MTTCELAEAERELDLVLLGGTILNGRTRAGVVPSGVKTRTLLAALALDAGAAVSTERLLAYLWEQEPPRSAVKNLQLYVLRLRRCLDTATAGLSRLLVRVGHGYRLDVPADAVDALRASDLTRRGGLALRDRDWPHAIAYLTAALACWPVDGLAGLVPSAPTLAVATLLRERRLCAVEQLATAKIAVGATGEAVDLLVSEAVGHSTRESAHVLLMRALADMGDRAGAIDVYHRLRRSLRDELGIEPGPQARELFDGLLAPA